MLLAMYLPLRMANDYRLRAGLEAVKIQKNYRKKMTIQINDILNMSELKDEFLKNGIVRVFDFLEQTSLEKISLSMEKNVSYVNAFFLEGQNREVSDAEIQKLPVVTQQQLYKDIHEAASRGTGFLYGRYKIDQDSLLDLKDTLQLFNSESILKLINEITGLCDLKSADGQATRFRRGDFLTRHIDNVPGETRRIAYVLGLTPAWHPDWGGLLQLYERDGTPTKSWSPVFNSLTLFDVDKVHSVTSIAPFALKSRYSITGWFRS